MTGATIVGIGQPRAGDDAVGIVVARALAERGAPALASTDASALLPLLARGGRVVVVDGLVGHGSPGDVLELDPRVLDRGARVLSSHGLGVAEGIELASILYGVDAAAVAVVAVVIDPSTLERPGLSVAVAAAIEPAAALALALAGLVPPRRRR